MNINHVVITGNITSDFTGRKTPNDVSVVRFNLANNTRKKNSNTGEWEDYANYFLVTAFGQQADFLSKYAGKGSKITVDGELCYRQWEDKDGNKRSVVEIIAKQVEILSQKKAQPEPQQQQQAPQYQQQQPQQPYQQSFDQQQMQQGYSY